METLAGNPSGGQRQALTLVMASLRTPRALLLDEHTAALDPEAAEATMRLTQGIAGRRMATLMVTHSMAHALVYGDRLILMNRGKLVEEIRNRVGVKPEDLTERFVRRYCEGR